METFLYTPNNDKSGYKFWMAYPAVEEFALASLGYMWLFKLSNTMDGISAERVYTDSETTKFDAREVEAIAFSLSFDFDFMGVFELLDKYKIPLKSVDRDEHHPLIFAGGPVVTTNLEPLKAFFDFFVVGDGEGVFPKVLEILKQRKPKTETMLELSRLDGIFVPDISKQVKKITEELKDVIYTPILSDKSYFKDTFIIEVSRGCMNRCAFCTASYLNLPYRYYDYEKIIETIDLGLKHTNKIALLGAQISAHPRFDDIMAYLRNKMDAGNDIELGISSLRTDAVTPELIQTLVKGGQKHSTIAIEAASERLRKLINKNLTNEQIINAVRVSRENGLRGLKIYSMIGIPSETQEDIEEFIKLAKLLKKENKGFEITFSFSSFVPKPHTPLQWAQREDTKTLEKKQKYLEKEFAKIGIGSKFSSIKWDYWQALISRADENFSEFLLNVYKEGGKNGAYKSALRNLKFEFLEPIEGFDFDKVLAWDNILLNINNQMLINEYNRLLRRGELTK